MLNQYNLQVFNYEYIFKNFIEKELINDLYNFKLLNKTKDSTIRRFFIHHNIHSICEFFLKSKKKGKQVLYFDFHNLLDSELSNYIDEDRLLRYFNFVFLKIKTLLPVRIYYSSFSFDYYVSKATENAGIGKETTFKIRSIVDSSNFEAFTFERIKKFVKKEHLTFLDKTYFNSIKSKQLLIN